MVKGTCAADLLLLVRCLPVRDLSGFRTASLQSVTDVPPAGLTYFLELR